MRIGIGLPDTLAPEVDRRLMLEWARTADEAGFAFLGTIDRPAYDGWDPLMALAGAAAVTERIRLATTIMHLPDRNEILVAKQAASLDVLSNGRLDLGLAVGWSDADYELLGEDFSSRGRRFPEQLSRMKAFWDGAREATEERAAPGPAPVQRPHPPIWLGGSTPKTVQRAVELGDAYIFGGGGHEPMAQMTPQIREQAAAAGKEGFEIGGLAYVAVDDDPAKAIEKAGHHYIRYYGPGSDPASSIHHGPGEVIAEAVSRYEAAGLDFLVLFAEIPDVEQVARLAEGLLR